VTFWQQLLACSNWKLSAMGRYNLHGYDCSSS